MHKRKLIHTQHPPMASPPIICLLQSLCVLAVFASAVELQRYPAVFNFGDSNSDTGELMVGLGGQLPPPYGRTFFGRPSGRFCDGRLLVDFFMDGMDLPYLNPYLDSVGTPSFRTGCNFAAAGSTILPATPSSVSPFSFGIQVAQFVHFKSRVLELLAEGGGRLKKYIPREDYFTDGLYTIDMGQNDLAGAFYTKTEDQILASIPSILLEFENGIERLYHHGARKFWIHNTGPLGCLPQNIERFGKEPSQFDEVGCLASHNRVARFFNLQLHALCAKLRGTFPDTNLTYTDIFTLKSDLMANYTRYGFKQNIMTCCGYGGPPLNYDPRIGCGQTKILNGSNVIVKGCDDTAAYLIWDGIHYTEAANLHVATQILTGKHSDPPFCGDAPLFLKPNY